MVQKHGPSGLYLNNGIDVGNIEGRKKLLEDGFKIFNFDEKFFTLIEIGKYHWYSRL